MPVLAEAEMNFLEAVAGAAAGNGYRARFQLRIGFGEFGCKLDGRHELRFEWVFVAFGNPNRLVHAPCGREISFRVKARAGAVFLVFVDDQTGGGHDVEHFVDQGPLNVRAPRGAAVAWKTFFILRPEPM